jgi:hypothetical protein
MSKLRLPLVIGSASGLRNCCSTGLGQLKRLKTIQRQSPFPSLEFVLPKTVSSKRVPPEPSTNYVWVAFLRRTATVRSLPTRSNCICEEPLQARNAQTPRFYFGAYSSWHSPASR